MNYQEFTQAKKSFDYLTLERKQKTLYSRRKEIVDYFNVQRIASMQLDDYVQGKRNKQSFCYYLEKELDGLGSITGATAKKFGVYYNKKKGEYVFAIKFGNTYEEAFDNVKKCILELLNAGKNEDYESLVGNPLSTMFKGKILATYYPDKYLNIFGNDHLDYFLNQLDLDTISLKRKDPIYKRKALIDFKNSDKDMSGWSNDMFTTFLYSHYSRTLNNKRNGVEGKGDISFPIPDKSSFEYITINWKKTTLSNKEKKVNGKIDYEEEARLYKELGDRGENIVMKNEVQRIQQDFNKSEVEAKEIVIWRSRESDDYGYDIESLNDDGSTRYIEVKATKADYGNIIFYYTANELEASKKYGNNYYIYIVTGITKKHPKIRAIQNPFIGENKLELIPIKFRVPLYIEPDKSI